MSLEINEKMWRYSKYVDINKQSRNMKKEKNQETKENCSTTIFLDAAKAVLKRKLIVSMFT